MGQVGEVSLGELGRVGTVLLETWVTGVGQWSWVSGLRQSWARVGVRGWKVRDAGVRWG